ncbi:hypothetical protein OSB04_017781, partial [Centaurea solstitialis]
MELINIFFYLCILLPILRIRHDLLDFVFYVFRNDYYYNADPRLRFVDLPIIRFGDLRYRRHGSVDDMCLMCSRDYDHDHVVCQLRRCGHVFHSDCVAELLQTEQHHCPFCRSPIFSGLPTVALPFYFQTPMIGERKRKKRVKASGLGNAAEIADETGLKPTSPWCAHGMGLEQVVNVKLRRYRRPHWVQTNSRQFWAEARLLKHAARGRSPLQSNNVNEDPIAAVSFPTDVVFFDSRLHIDHHSPSVNVTKGGEQASTYYGIISEYGPWWNPVVVEQAVMYINGIGQTKGVSIKCFIMK